MIDIVQKGDPVLRQVALPVALTDISSKRIKKIISDMKQALTEQDDAVAIAAPQIGHSLRIFVISGKVFTPGYPDDKKITEFEPDIVCINPEIINLSRKKEAMTEGCLSVRWLYGTVKRSTKATIKALDEQGNSFTRGGSGLLAQIFQHEIDHLDGILFVDTATDIEDQPPENLKDSKK